MKRLLGFTLIEVLVALGIVALALGSGVRATNALTRNAQRQSDQMLAQLCAENAMIAVRLAKQMPAVGENDRTCEQGGRSFNLHLTVAATPNPNFMRIDAQVLEGEASILSLATVVGRF